MQFLGKVVDMPVFMQHRCFGPDSAQHCRVSAGAVQVYCPSCCNDRCIGPDSADLDVTGPVLGQGCRARVVQRQIFRHDSQHCFFRFVVGREKEFMQRALSLLRGAMRIVPQIMENREGDSACASVPQIMV